MGLTNLQDKTILVAGAAGFVPGHLCEYYLEKGATVLGVDNFITGTQANIDVLSKYPNFEFYECNVYEDLPRFAGKKIDYIFSMASPASPIDFKTLPIEIMRVNGEGTYKLLELAKDRGATFLEASTSEVYGDPEVHPQVESYHGNVNPIGVRSCYDESKRYAEALTMSYHRRYGVDTRIVRIFNTYGPRMRPDDGRVIPNFVNQAISGKDITIYGDGKQTRSFCYVSDLVRGIDEVISQRDHTPFNVGNPDEYTILDAANIIVDSLKSSSKIITGLPLPSDDPKRRRPNIDKLTKKTGYRPEVSFIEGLKRTTEYFKQIL